jgi:REP-associated tyrosine transposase
MVIPKHFDTALVDEFIVMPNHVHGIVMIRDVGARHAVPVSRRFGKPAAGSLAAIVGSFKSATTRRINELRQTPGISVWQRNYYEHVVRGDDSLDRIREYITSNPARWDVDRENPAATCPEAQFAWRA